MIFPDMKPRYRIKFYMSSHAGIWSSVCYFIKGEKEVLISGSSEFYGVIGRNGSIVFIDNRIKL